MSPAATVEQFLDAFAAGDAATALAVIADDVAVSEPAGVPGGGELEGKQAFLGFLGTVAATYEVTLGERTLLEVGDRVVAFIASSWRSVASGRAVASRHCEVYTVVDGLVTAIDVYPKDSRALYEVTQPEVASAAP